MSVVDMTPMTMTMMTATVVGVVGVVGDSVSDHLEYLGPSFSLHSVYAPAFVTATTVGSI